MYCTQQRVLRNPLDTPQYFKVHLGGCVKHKRWWQFYQTSISIQYIITAVKKKNDKTPIKHKKIENDIEINAVQIAPVKRTSGINNQPNINIFACGVPFKLIKKLAKEKLPPTLGFAAFGLDVAAMGICSLSAAVSA